jgi:hypothetical protein
VDAAKHGNFPPVPFSRVDRRSQMRCMRWTRHRLKGVTGTSQLHLDRWRPISGGGTSAGAHIALGWIDSWQAVAYPCQVVELSRDPRIRSAADNQMKKKATAMPCIRANRALSQGRAIIPRVRCQPQRQDCAGSSDSPTIPKFPILDHRAVASREKH